MKSPTSLDRRGAFCYIRYMGKWKHRMLVVDIEQGEGECDYCGEVKVVKKGKRWACVNGIKEQKSHKGKHGASPKIVKIYLDNFSMCMICNSTLNLVVDHDHKTKKIRGILCHHCNVGLGFFRDNEEFLSNAIKYLNK